MSRRVSVVERDGVRTVCVPGAPPAFAAALAGELVSAIDQLGPSSWEPADRPPLEPHQVPPPGPWSLWLLEGGRSCGKTEACSRYFARYMREHPGARGRIIAPTNGDAVEACVRGPSGLLAMDPEIRFVAASAGGGKLFWPNGSEALVIGTAGPRDVERLRAGGNRDLDWWEELAANKQLAEAWDQAALGLRIGHPHSIASTTPRRTNAYRAIRAMPGVVHTYATIDDNPHNPPEWRARMHDRYDGTRLGRQELLGELLEDVDGALWSEELIDANRIEHVDRSELLRVIVAVDPAVTAGPKSNETGIIVAGIDKDGHGYVLEDATCRLPPERWAQRVVSTYHRWSADRVVAEKNNGYALLESVMRNVAPSLPLKLVWAGPSKGTRAEPVVALYEQGRIHHVGAFPALEDQLVCWVPGEGDSPDRLDAAVWAFTELMPSVGTVAAPILLRRPSRWAPLRVQAGMT